MIPIRIIDSESKRKITEHAIAIDLILKNVFRTKKGLKCDICGSGDYTTKSGVVLRPKDIVHGYEHRIEESPVLCHRHLNGWAHSYSRFNWNYDKTNQDIDLHFALYVANQLFKEANKEKQYARLSTFGKFMLQDERDKTIGVA